ncbi:MAG: hypothetical protein K9L68_14630 [Spirochaetales bacterium]|nr:hypothetical protein [Spirochaetales bacterium]
MKKTGLIAFILTVFLSMPVYAVTPSKLLGDYSLTSLQITVDGSTIPNSSISNEEGNLSITTKGLVVELSGDVYGDYSWYHGYGFYEMASSNTISATIVGEDTTSITLSYSNGTLSANWSEYDQWEKATFEYDTTWNKTTDYYTQEEYDSKGSQSLSYTLPSLSSGWNLLGYTGTQSEDIEVIVGTTEESVLSVWKWNGGKWSVYLTEPTDNGQSYAESKGFTLLQQIDPNDGFWINCN